MKAMFKALRRGDPPDDVPEPGAWAVARAWGWVLESGELTGMGANHAGPLCRGILPPGI
jgi:hypothetical protein